MTGAPPGARVRPRIAVGPSRAPLPAAAERLLRRVVVDQHAHLPDMFELTFGDRDGGALAAAGLALGALVAVSAAGVAGGEPVELVVGEVTAVEGIFDDHAHVVVRGFSQDHRLQRVRRSRAFRNVKDSDIARRIAADHGLAVGGITQSKTAHEHVGQVNQTDWEFLRDRAGAIGYEFGVVGGEFHFGPAATAATATAVDLAYPGALRRFAPRVSAGNLAARTEVRLWDQASAKVVAAVVPTTADGVAAGDPADPGAATAAFRPKPAPTPPPRGGPAGDLGPAPADGAFVVATAPVARGASAEAAAREVAAGLAGRLGATVAEATGESDGDPRLRPGGAARVSGVGEPFDGTWVLTRVVHAFERGGYTTRFDSGGARPDAAPGRTADPATVPGVVCGVVTDVADPDGLGRVRVALPWLSPAFESDWAVVAHPGAGQRGGAVLLPDVGDQVLVAFEFGDPRRPYVLGGLFDDRARYDLGGPPVTRQGAAGSVVWRGLVTPTGNRLAFHDELTPGARPTATASEIVLGTAGGDLGIAVDQVAGTVAVRCAPAPSGGGPAAPGKLTIECGKAGAVEIRAGEGGRISIGGGARLDLSATAAVKIESTGPVEIKGNPIKLN